MPQLIQTLCNVYFKLTLSVCPKIFTLPIVSLSITETKSRIVLRTDSGNPVSRIQISVCNTSCSKGIAHKLYNVPKYRTYPTYGQKPLMTYTPEEFPHIYIMRRMHSSDTSLSAVSARVVRIHTIKEIPRYARSEGGGLSGSGRQQQRCCSTYLLI